MIREANDAINHLSNSREYDLTVHHSVLSLSQLREICNALHRADLPYAARIAINHIGETLTLRLIGLPNYELERFSLGVCITVLEQISATDPDLLDLKNEVDSVIEHISEEQGRGWPDDWADEIDSKNCGAE